MTKYIALVATIVLIGCATNSTGSADDETSPERADKAFSVVILIVDVLDFIAGWVWPDSEPVERDAT